jgi:Zn ribbon nucleic-acid-binding protein
MAEAICPYCNEFFEFPDPDDYWETDEGDAIEGIICPHCDKELAVYYETIANFDVREPTSDEKEELDF